MKPVPSDPYLDEIVLVYTPEEFERMSEIGLSWIVQREGVTLYKRSSCCSTTVVPVTAGVLPPHTGVNRATEFLRGGSLSCATGYQTLSGPCQRANQGTRSACSVALASMPTAARPSAD